MSAAFKRARGWIAAALAGIGLAITTGFWIVLYAFGYTGPAIELGSSSWQPVTPLSISGLPELTSLAPHMRIDDAVVYGFQDKVYRFRFTAKDQAAFAAALRSKNAFVEAKDGPALIDSLLSSFATVADAPAWFSSLTDAERRDVTVYTSTISQPRFVVLIDRSGRWSGQVMER